MNIWTPKANWKYLEFWYKQKQLGTPDKQITEL